MQPDQIKQLVEAHVPDSHVQVGIDGSHINLLVVSPAFVGMSPVKKQQMVYAALSESIAQGTIHAVHMKTLTPEEWQQQQA
ncbi:BolA family protein [Marinimicrobium sp. ARAG 43.8]|uniref:BolA family protein n=1 Tax=Marinimicrobium sp. ARAG 43.8 TaxID=3418719 RepID=UPI003CEC66F1